MQELRTFALLLAGTLTCAQAQWFDYRDPKTPRTKDGRPNLSAPVPMFNGKPDLSGVWQAERTPREEFVQALGEDFVGLQVDIGDATKHVVNIFWGLKPDQEPLSSEGAAALKQIQQSGEEPGLRCLPSSLPSAMFLLVFKMIQTPTEIVSLFENGDPPRQIYTDGRTLPRDPQPSWMGHSAGKWQGDTLVVETVGITDRASLDIIGHPRSEQMKITERYRRRDYGHMDLEITFEDPKYYTRPFTIKTSLTLVPDTDVLEYICAENEKDRVHVVK